MRKTHLSSGRLLNRFCKALRLAGIPFTGEGYIVHTTDQYDDQVDAIVLHVHNKEAWQEEELKRKDMEYNPRKYLPEGWKEIFGWWSPDGQYIETKPFNHIEAIRTNPILQITSWAEIEEALADVERGCQALQDKEGRTNAEWHMYEIACSRASTIMYLRLIEAGFIRLGTRLQELCCEGKPEAIQKHKLKLDDFAEGYKLICKYEPQKHVPEPVGL